MTESFPHLLPTPWEEAGLSRLSEGALWARNIPGFCHGQDASAPSRGLDLPHCPGKPEAKALKQHCRIWGVFCRSLGRRASLVHQHIFLFGERASCLSLSMHSQGWGSCGWEKRPLLGAQHHPWVLLHPSELPRKHLPELSSWACEAMPEVPAS